MNVRTVLLQTTPQQGGGGGDLLQQLVTLLPRILVAILLLVLLIVVGIVLGGRARRFAERIDLPRAVLETPLGAPFRDENAVGLLIGSLVKYLFYVVGVVVALSLIGFGRLTTYGDVVVRYFPSVIGGVLIVLVGVIVAGYVGRSIKESAVFGGSDLAVVGAEVTKGVIYFVSVTLGLDAFGYSTTILNTLAQAVAIGIGLGIAAAIGIAVGMGSQDYVAAHIEEWVEGDTGEE